MCQSHVNLKSKYREKNGSGETHWIFSIISVSVSGDFSSKIREARGFFVDEVTRLDYAETGAPWKETGEAEGGLTSLGESLAPRVKATREFTHRYDFELATFASTSEHYSFFFFLIIFKRISN